MPCLDCSSCQIKHGTFTQTLEQFLGNPTLNCLSCFSPNFTDPTFSRLLKFRLGMDQTSNAYPRCESCSIVQPQPCVPLETSIRPPYSIGHQGSGEKRDKYILVCRRQKWSFCAFVTTHSSAANQFAFLVLCRSANRDRRPFVAIGYLRSKLSMAIMQLVGRQRSQGFAQDPERLVVWMHALLGGAP